MSEEFFGLYEVTCPVCQGVFEICIGGWDDGNYHGEAFKSEPLVKCAECGVAIVLCELNSKVRSRNANRN